MHHHLLLIIIICSLFFIIIVRFFFISVCFLITQLIILITIPIHLLYYQVIFIQLITFSSSSLNIRPSRHYLHGCKSSSSCSLLLHCYQLILKLLTFSHFTDPFYILLILSQYYQNSMRPLTSLSIRMLLFSLLLISLILLPTHSQTTNTLTFILILLILLILSEYYQNNMKPLTSLSIWLLILILLFSSHILLPTHS